MTRSSVARDSVAVVLPRLVPVTPVAASAAYCIALAPVAAAVLVERLEGLAPRLTAPTIRRFKLGKLLRRLVVAATDEVPETSVSTGNPA